MFSTKLKWKKLAESRDTLTQLLADRETIGIHFAGIECLLVNHGSKLYLVRNKCPHQGQRLDNAKCEEGFIVCPWHRYGFDLKTGRGAGLYLENFPLDFRSDGVYAGIEYCSWFGE